MTNIIYNSKTVPIKSIKNVFIDDEFRLKLPEGFKLQAMPNMSWKQVLFFTKNFSVMKFFRL